MTQRCEGWVRAAAAPARRLEPSEAEVARVLVETAVRGDAGARRLGVKGVGTRAKPWRRRGGRFNIALAVIAGVLLMTAIAVASGLVSPGVVVPGGTDRPKADRPEASGPETSATRVKRDSLGRRIYKPEPGSEEEKAYVATEDFYDVFKVANRDLGKHVFANTDRALGTMVFEVCRAMSRAAWKQIQATSPSLDDDPELACQQSVGVHFGPAVESGDAAVQPRIVGIERNGDKATVRVQFPLQEPRRVPMVKEGGRWKIDAVPESDGE